MRYACLVLGFVSFVQGQSVTTQDLPRIADPEVLAIEMAKALVAGDRPRVTALAATRSEMERLLETAQPPSRPDERDYIRKKVAGILADNRTDFDRFQAMKKTANVAAAAAVRFELITMDSIYEKDGMKKIRHSRVRMIQSLQGGTTKTFLISLDDMFLFPRGWAFTSISPGIGPETSKQ